MSQLPSWPSRRSRWLVVVSIALTCTVAGGTASPAAAGSSVGPLPVDQPPVLTHDSGDYLALAVSVGRTQPRADGIQLVGGCEVEQQVRHNSNETVVVVNAEASALTGPVTAYGHPVAVGVDCTFTDLDGQDPPVKVSAAQAGATVAGVATAIATPRRAQLCMSMTAVYSDNTFAWTETACL